MGLESGQQGRQQQGVDIAPLGHRLAREMAAYEPHGQIEHRQPAMLHSYSMQPSSCFHQLNLFTTNFTTRKLVNIDMARVGR